MSLGAILNDSVDNVDNADTNDSQDSFVPPPTLPELNPEPQPQNDDEEDGEMEVATASQRRKSSSKKKGRNKKAEPEPEPEPEVEPTPEPAAVEDDMELGELEDGLANLKTERPDHDSDDDVDMEDRPATQSQHISETPGPVEEEEESPSSPLVHVKSEPGVDDEDEDIPRLEQEDAADEEDDSPALTKLERLNGVMDAAQSAYDSGYVETDGSAGRSQRFATQVSPALDHEEATPSEDEAMQHVKSAPEEDDDVEMDGTPDSEASPAQELKAAPESDGEEERTPESEAEEEQALKAKPESSEEEESEADDEEPVNDPLEPSADEEEADEEHVSEIPESELGQPEIQPEESRLEPASDAETAPPTQTEQADVNGATIQSSPDLGGDDAPYAASPFPPPPSSARARSSTKRKAKRAFNPDAPPSEPETQLEPSSARPQKKRKARAQPEEVGEEEEEANVPTPVPKKKRTKKIKEVLLEQEEGENEEEAPDASTPASKQKKATKAKKPKKAASEEQEERLDKHGYAMGRLTAVEEDKVTKAVNKFRRDEGLTQAEINKIIHDNPAEAAHAARGAPTLHAPLWAAVCEACPSRSRLKLQKFCRRKFHNFVARGQWTAEQDEELQQMMKIHGNKWTVIGGLINRHPQDVRDRWRDYIVCQDKVVKHEWSNEEEGQLIEAVKDAIDKIRKDLIARGEDEGQAESLVNWQGISEAMGRTRNRLQCMEKWKRVLKSEPVADRDRVVTLLPDTDTWRVKMARQDLTKITPAEKYRLACIIRDGCAETEREIDWRRITERVFKDKYQRQALVVIWGRLRSSVPNHADKAVHECAQHVVDMYDEDAGFGDSYGDYPDEKALPPSAKKPPASAKKGKKTTKSRPSRRSTSAASAKKKKPLSEELIVDETDSEAEGQPEEDTVMEDARSIASDAPPIDSDEEQREEEEEAAEEAAEEEAEAPPPSSVVQRLAPDEDDASSAEDETRPPFEPSPSVEAEAARTRRRERSLSAKPPTPAPIEEESGEEVQDEDMVTSTRLKSAKKRPAAEDTSPRKKKRKTSEGSVRPAVLTSSSPAVTYGRKSNSRKENKKAAAEALKARQARALSTISSDMDDMDDIPARLPGQTPPRPTPQGRTTRRVARQ
ncbi:putative DNA-binding protein [Cercophora samala]|uniref:DNA-binding protein n=1 Tax=Cercophora samala TaxID=330535 RepID=A0AA39ZAS3_9PEZI|nr:putative DNA-binding protein [Cercophora samala]